jgi:hypothetical protein
VSLGIGLHCCNLGNGNFGIKHMPWVAWAGSNRPVPGGFDIWKASL